MVSIRILLTIHNLSEKGMGIMDLKHLEYIVAIAEEQNLTKAAERLFVSQSTLSVFLKKLEKDLGITLFSRDKNRLIITRSGELYVDTARKILLLKQELYDNLRIRQTAQVLNIGIASQNMFQAFARAFAIFKPQSPELNVNVTEGRGDAILEKLISGKLDIAVMGRDKIVPSDHYIARVLQEDEVCLVLSPSHPKASAASDDYDCPPVADMALFSHENFALSPRDTSDYRIAVQLLNDYHMNANIICELNDTKSLCQMILQGVCLSIMPRYGVPRDMGLVVCRPDRLYKRYMVCYQRRDRKLTHDESLLFQVLLDTYNHFYDD